MEVTSDFILQVLGAKVVELAMSQIKVAQLEQQLQAQAQEDADGPPSP